MAGMRHNFLSADALKCSIDLPRKASGNSSTEGWHLRRGYSDVMLHTACYIHERRKKRQDCHRGGAGR